MSEKKIFKRKIGEREQEMYGDMGNDGDGSGREQIVQVREMGVRTAGKVFVCGDEISEKDMFAVADETWFTGGEG